jgi:hypothetical protein
MEHRSTLLSSEEPATGPYSQPDESSTHPIPFKIHYNIILPPTLRSSMLS